MRRRSPLLLAGALTVSAVLPALITAVAPASVASAATVPAGFADELVGSVSSPTTVETLPPDRIVALEQGGRVRIARVGGGGFADAGTIPSVCAGGERGLLGITADPGFLTNGWVYLYYTRHAGGAPGGCVNRVSRFTLGASIDPASEVVLLDNISSVNGNHNGGDLDIGVDGNLYVSVGDAGRDPRGDSGSAGANDAARDWSLLNGKILRITTSGLPVPGNPFMGPGSERCAFRGNLPSTPTTACQEIYAWGLRNPYRIDVDTDGGSGRIFANDVGQGTREEVDDIVAGGDYGWNVREGVCPRGQTPPCAGPPAGMIDPIADYGRTFGQYITGAAFAPHGRWPTQYDGAYFFGDGGSGRIFVRFADGSFDPSAPFATGAGEISDMVFGFDALGRTALYYAVSGGSQVRRIVWTGDSPAPMPAGLTFSSAGPIRAYDTRNAIGTAGGQVRGGTSRRIALTPPSGDVRAALVNITVTNARGPGFVQAWTPRTRLPNTSVANVDGGGTVANSAIIALDSANTFLVHVTPTADVVVDVMGWFSDSGGGAVTAGRFEPAGPERLVDTRHPSSATNAYSQVGDRYDMPVAGRLGVPASGASSAVVVLTALGQTGVDGWAGAHAGGSAWSGTSNVNTNVPYDIRANLAIVPLGADGSISVTTFRLTDVIVDVVGYITSGAAPSSTAGKYTAIAPTRVVDTRSTVGFGRLGDEQAASIDADAAVPALGAASAVAQNITLTDTSEELYVTAFPTGGAVPTVSNANATWFGQTRAAAAITRLSAGNDESFFAWRDTHLIVDIVGYFTE